VVGIVTMVETLRKPRPRLFAETGRAAFWLRRGRIPPFSRRQRTDLVPARSRSGL